MSREGSDVQDEEANGEDSSWSVVLEFEAFMAIYYVGLCPCCYALNQWLYQNDSNINRINYVRYKNNTNIGRADYV